MRAWTTLALFFPFSLAAVGAEKISVNPPFWVKGSTVSLQIAMPDSKKCPQIAVEFKSKTESLTQPIKAQSPKNGVVELDLAPYLGRFKPGEVQVTTQCPETLGPVKIQILKPLEKTDFDKSTPEHLEKIHAVLVTGEGVMRLEFYPKQAPNTVRNFLKLSAKGFYDGTPFHRVMKDFMIQGGDPTGTGTGGPGYQIKAEFSDLRHEKGVISMAREEGNNDSAGCQFFIVHAAHAANLDRQYTVFGKLLDGWETLDKIASAPVAINDGEASKPLVPVVIKKVILVEKP